MTRTERQLLLAAVALGLGRGPVSSVVSPEDREFLASLMGGGDWASVVTGLLPLLKEVATAPG